MYQGHRENQEDEDLMGILGREDYQVILLLYTRVEERVVL